MSMDLSPLAFFDARSHGLIVNSTCLDRIEEEESEIVRFIRTPEGTGVGALRLDGGDTWRITERGTKIVRAGKWDQADFVVVLAHGEHFGVASPWSNILTSYCYRTSVCNLLESEWNYYPTLYPSTNPLCP